MEEGYCKYCGARLIDKYEIENEECMTCHMVPEIDNEEYE